MPCLVTVDALGGAMRSITLTFWAIACAGPADEPTDTGTDDPQGACGDVSAIDVTITGTVRDGDQQWVPGAEVALEERNWEPGTIHGQATTDADGRFTMSAVNLPVVEGCWGVVVQFWLIGTSGDLSGEKPMNSLIIGAYTDETFSVDLGGGPLILR